MISLLETDSSLIVKAVRHLKAKKTDHGLQPDPLLLCLLLDKGLFEEASGALQAALIHMLRDSPQPPTFPIDNAISDANSIMLPSLVAHLARQGCYAQAAELCAYHTCLHPAYYSFSAGLQRLQPYLHAYARRQQDYAVPAGSSLSEQWALPNTLLQLVQTLSSSAELALQRMSQDKVNELL